MIDKIINSYYNGTLTEKIFQSCCVRLQNIATQTNRFKSKFVQNHALKLVPIWYQNKQTLKALLENSLGDFSHFKETVGSNEQGAIIAEADRYLNHIFNILGSGNKRLDPIDWHVDFKSGFRWKPGSFYKDYVQVDTTNNADVKIPRELSRCHHFLVLGQAYLLTHDEKYTREFIEQITSWTKENPLMQSINWGCTMDVALRAINWIWALGMFFSSPLLTDTFLQSLASALYQHGYFIFRNPEKVPINNHNHYDSDLVGQVYLGILFRQLPEGKRWLNKGIREIYHEMRLQLLPSGPSYERSTNYIRLVCELFSSAVLLFKKNNIEIPLDIWYRLENLFEFILYAMKPDGTVPVAGDQDDGRVHPFGREKNIDYRYLLSIGAVLFNRADFKKYSNGLNPHCFFLLGHDAEKHFKTINDDAPPLESRRFPDAGFFIMRKNNNYMFINCSGKSKYNELSGGTHTHSDLLSFELFVEDKTFLVDPGSYVYSANPKERMHFRSTPMHNTATVDGQNQNIIHEEGLWDFERNAIPRINKWESTPACDSFDGEHSGYQRLPAPVTHRRIICFNKKNIVWEITDVFIGKGMHVFEIYFHFDTGIDIEINHGTARTCCQNGVNLVMLFASKQQLTLTKETGWVSKAYGERDSASILKVSFSSTVPAEVKTTIKRLDLAC